MPVTFKSYTSSQYCGVNLTVTMCHSYRVVHNERTEVVGAELVEKIGERVAKLDHALRRQRDL